MPKGFSLFLSTLAVVSTLGFATARSGHAAQPAPQENSGRNTRDQGGNTVTPEDQNESSADRNLAASIRKTVVKDKSLSVDAHNAKIIVRGGLVTLRGPVETPAEKAKLQTIAEKTRGVKQVDNQLEPKSP